MDEHETQQSRHQQIIMDRFVEACQADERVVAAFLGGSYARGTNDAYSDLDLYLIISDEAYSDFFSGREIFLRRLGDPLFLEDYNEYGFDLILFIFANGVEGELGIGRQSHFTHIHAGPFKVLVDKKGILEEVMFPSYEPPEAEQIETLRSLINWFWHDLQHHFMTPIARGQLWSAYGALEDLRLTCVNMARLRQNFIAKPEGYEKLEQAVPIEQLAPLQASFCPMESHAMLQAALIIVRFYQELAPPLAQAHGLLYPSDLARVMNNRLEILHNANEH